MAGKTETSGGFFLTRWMRKLYQWMMHWAETPQAEKMLGILSFAESSFFPIPPDVLLIPMGVAKPKKAIRYGAITSVASILGGMLGYLIGYLFFDTVGIKIIEFYGLMDKYWQFREWFEMYNFAIIMVAGLTPLPYKVFTITAGVAGVNFPIFVLGSVMSRSVRFMAEGVVCYYGDFFSDKIFKMPIREALDKYINWFGILMAVLGVLGFMVVKLVLPGSEVDLCHKYGESKEQVCLRSEPDAKNQDLYDYRLTLIADGSSVHALAPGGPFPKPSRGEAELSRLTIVDRDVIAAVFYEDQDPSKGQGTNGLVMFFEVKDKNLKYLGEYGFPRYRLGEGGYWEEGKVTVKSEPASGPEPGIQITLENIHHPPSGGEITTEQQELHFRVGDKLEPMLEKPGGVDKPAPSPVP